MDDNYYSEYQLESDASFSSRRFPMALLHICCVAIIFTHSCVNVP